MSYHSRKTVLLKKLVDTVKVLPVHTSGLWFHHDLRNNVYYTLHMFEAASLELFESEEKKKTALNLAEKILLQCISLQDRTKNSDTYGHWPLALNAEDPTKSKPNKLPAELMGNLLIHFYTKHKSRLSKTLQTEMETSLLHLYQSRFYCSDLSQYNHHESKWISLQLNLGNYFDDQDLLQDGYRRLNILLEHVKEHGFFEYGSLPWHWHWIQAFTSAAETITDPFILTSLKAMLEFLWQERGRYYLKGTWVGAHSRSLPHDIPRDGNIWFDFLQYGDFSEPSSIQRLEGAGLFDYTIPEHLIRAAVHRKLKEEIKRKIPTKQGTPLHNYVFMTNDYAVGGMWEYSKEYQNEQHRWNMTLPLNDTEGANQAFFFHPGERNSGKNDLQHQSPYSQVLFHKNIVMNTYVLPEDTTSPYIIGCLPKGKWTSKDNGKHWFGQVENLYLAVYSFQPLKLVELDHYNRLDGSGLIHGIVLEVWDSSDAQAADVITLEDFAEKAYKQKPVFNMNQLKQQIEIMHTASSSGDRIHLFSNESELLTRSVNGKNITFNDYIV